jgi:uncharacterized SAM-dependent methyltransferase
VSIPYSAQAPPLESVVDFAADVRRDLALTPKQIQSKYLYNALGSALFEAICRLPWYRITRAEGRLLKRYSGEMVESLQDPITIVELGSGSGEKLAMLAERLRSRRKRVLVHLVDISPAALELSERTLGALEHVSVVGHRATYEEGLRHAATQRPEAGTLLVIFLGSNIGNFDRPASDEFLREIRSCLRPEDALLLGTDLVKPESDLLLAYDDPLGVTAAFNKNLLARMNTELLADFDLQASTTERCGTPPRAASRCTSSRGALRPCGSRAPRSRCASSRANGSGPRAPTSTRESGSPPWATRRDSRCASSGSSRTRASRSPCSRHGSDTPV